MSEKYGGVVYDVDNTVYDHKTKRVPKLAQEALRRLEVPAMPATGRSYPLMLPLAEKGIRLTGLGSLDSGATIVDFDSKSVVWEKWLDPQQVSEVMRKVGGKCLDISASTLKQRVKIDPKSIDGRFAYREKSPSVFAIYPLQEQAALQEIVGDIDEVSSRFMRYENSTTLGCFQVTYAGINKEPGVRMLLDMAGLQNERIVGIGDDYKGDGPIFAAIRAMKKRGKAVAMGNADNRLKADADMVVAGVSDTPDGFTDAMRRLDLIDANI